MELTPEERRQQDADRKLDLEPHGPGRGSKLEAHRVAIEKMRALRWPYRRIAEWLQTERGLSTYPETIRSFCRVRGIAKGQPQKAATQRSARPAAPNDPANVPPNGPTKKKARFVPPEGPLRTRSNGLLGGSAD